MSFLGHKILNDMISRAQEREIKLELRTKCKPEQVQTMVGQEKKPKVSVLHPRGQQGQIHYGKCGNPYGRECRAVGSGCFRCGQSGHMSRDCPWDALIFFHCYQIGHKKVDFLSGGAVAAPGPTTLRINDGRQGMAETPVVKIRGFKLTTDEDRETLDVVTSNCLYNIFYFFPYFMLMSY